MAGPGRPKGSTILNPELAAALVEDRKGPLPDADVALKNGVSIRAVKYWIVAGLKEDAQEPFKSFAEDWCRAKIGKKLQLLQIVEDATKVHDGTNFKQRGDYKSAVFLLSHMWPKHFGDRVQESGHQEGDIDVEQLVAEVESESSDLDALLLSPPVPLLEAMRRCAPELRLLLDEIAPVHQLAEVSDDTKQGSSE